MFLESFVVGGGSESACMQSGGVLCFSARRQAVWGSLNVLIIGFEYC